jgi:FkbM family methyltransferase
MDPLATLLRRTPDFKGKGRLINRWVHTRSGTATRALPGGELTLDLGTPYEAMVWLGFEEREELEALAGLLRPGDTFVDCGANIGLWSLTAAGLVGPTGRVIAVEPNPAVAPRLERHAATAGNVSVVRAAVGERAGTARYDAGATHNLGRLDPSGAQEVDVVALDDVVEPPVAGLKIDVEGHELGVLRGGARLLESRPWIAVELNKEHESGGSLAAWPVHQHLTGLGYAPFSFGGERLTSEWSPEHGYANVLYRAA